MNTPTVRQFVFVSTSVFFLCLLLVVFGYGPTWETNDDVGMAMIAHGYGFVGKESPLVLYSNVIWGQLVSALPVVFGMDGYSIATYLVLLLVGVSLSFSLYERTKRMHVSILIVAMVLFKPAIEPQFTINAGLMMSAAAFWLISFTPGSSVWRLAMFVVFAFISYLLRSQEAMFVFLLATPLVYRPSLLKQKPFWLSLAILGGLIFVAKSIDDLAYSGEEWRSYRELNAARAPYTDFGADRHVGANPKVLDKYGYSKNDLKLIANWFFLDETIASSAALNGMVNDTKFFDLKRPRSFEVDKILTRISSSYLGVLLFLVLMLLIYSRSKRLFFSFAGFVAAIFILSYIGRGHILRIYYPVVSLMFLYGCAQLNWTVSWFDRRSLPQLIVISALFFFSNNWLDIVTNKKKHAQSVRANVLSIEHEYPIVAWGNSLDYSMVYKIGDLTDALMKKKIIALGTSSLMPNSNASLYSNVDAGVIDTLLSTGLVFIASHSQINTLNTYCQENHKAELNSRVLRNVGKYQAYFVKCSHI